ncbi:L-amino acid N-acyltransferase YncA [Humitalea rosea]|uniref:L-amino acid N-acyltransferase YncA n=1 Tax=Humitalea rosea TaxID=990373 RepID=A0A2W7KPV1_9PROT|nr:GNAT family N-acetyltransferase [Humitalea rosea]PZW50345.1 L-amino acid N-acyltransferase YncA [Humitalea rosea]
MDAMIRPGGAGDRPALIEQFLGLNLHEEAIVGNRRTDHAGAEACLEAAEREVAASGGRVLVAERAGRVIGHVFIVMRRDAVFVREALRPYAYVLELFVRAEARGLGIGSALLAEAERFARAQGMARLRIGVLAGNDGAEALYRRSGFAPAVLEMDKPLR